MPTSEQNSTPSIPRRLVKLVATWSGENQPCWIDPATVTGLFPAGYPATTRLEYAEHGCQLVLGTPEDVYAALFESDPEIEAMLPGGSVEAEVDALLAELGDADVVVAPGADIDADDLPDGHPRVDPNIRPATRSEEAEAAEIQDRFAEGVARDEPLCPELAVDVRDPRPIMEEILQSLKDAVGEEPS